MQTMLLRVICFCVLLGILVAGLWPFHAPRNEVGWLGDGNGLLFREPGSIVSANPFNARVSQGVKSCSLEIALEPSHLDSEGMILSFYWPEKRVAPFALRQWREGLVLERESQVHSGMKVEKYVGDVFRGIKPILLTITSNDGGTSTYVDGTLVQRLPDFTISNRDMTGQFLMGNAPSMSYTWSGQVKGLAIYDRELSTAEVSTDFVEWMKGKKLDSVSNGGVVARYLFQEGMGKVIHNQVDSATDLIIPDHFFVVDQRILQRPWTEFRPGRWSYWKNVGINILGFIPLGFFFCSYLSQIPKVEHSAAVAVAFGFFLSLIIEVLQAFLPTRDSGMTDIITNTLGTAVGVMAFRHKAIQAVLSRAMIGNKRCSVSVEVG